MQQYGQDLIHITRNFGISLTGIASLE